MASSLPPIVCLLSPPPEANSSPPLGASKGESQNMLSASSLLDRKPSLLESLKMRRSSSASPIDSLSQRVRGNSIDSTTVGIDPLEWLRMKNASGKGSPDQLFKQYVEEVVRPSFTKAFQKQQLEITCTEAKQCVAYIEKEILKKPLPLLQKYPDFAISYAWQFSQVDDPEEGFSYFKNTLSAEFIKNLYQGIEYLENLNGSDYVQNLSEIRRAKTDPRHSGDNLLEIRQFILEHCPHLKTSLSTISSSNSESEEKHEIGFEEALKQLFQPGLASSLSVGLETLRFITEYANNPSKERESQFYQFLLKINLRKEVIQEILEKVQKSDKVSSTQAFLYLAAQYPIIYDLHTLFREIFKTYSESDICEAQKIFKKLSESQKKEDEAGEILTLSKQKKKSSSNARGIEAFINVGVELFYLKTNGEAKNKDRLGVGGKSSAQFWAPYILSKGALEILRDCDWQSWSSYAACVLESSAHSILMNPDPKYVKDFNQIVHDSIRDTQCVKEVQDKFPRVLSQFAKDFHRSSPLYFCAEDGKKSPSSQSSSLLDHLQELKAFIEMEETHLSSKEVPQLKEELHLIFQFMTNQTSEISGTSKWLNDCLVGELEIPGVSCLVNYKLQNKERTLYKRGPNHFSIEFKCDIQVMNNVTLAIDKRVYKAEYEYHIKLINKNWFVAPPTWKIQLSSSTYRESFQNSISRPRHQRNQSSFGGVTSKNNPFFPSMLLPQESEEP